MIWHDAHYDTPSPVGMGWQQGEEGLQPRSHHKNQFRLPAWT